VSYCDVYAQLRILGWRKIRLNLYVYCWLVLLQKWAGVIRCFTLTALSVRWRSVYNSTNISETNLFYEYLNTFFAFSRWLSTHANIGRGKRITVSLWFMSWCRDAIYVCLSVCLLVTTVWKVKVAHTRLPSVGFRSWSRFLAVSMQVTRVINPAVGCHYFPPGLQPLRGLPPTSHTMSVNSLPKTVTRQRRGCDFNPGPSAPESSTLTTRLPRHPNCERC